MRQSFAPFWGSCKTLYARCNAAVIFRVAEVMAQTAEKVSPCFPRIVYDLHIVSAPVFTRLSGAVLSLVMSMERLRSVLRPEEVQYVLLVADNGGVLKLVVVKAKVHPSFFGKVKCLVPRLTNQRALVTSCVSCRG